MYLNGQQEVLLFELLHVSTSYFPIQKIVNPYISGLSEDWATNSQQQLIKQGKTLHKEKKNLC